MQQKQQQPQPQLVRFRFRDPDSEDLTSNGGSWLLGRRRLERQASEKPRSPVGAGGKVQREMRDAARNSAKEEGYACTEYNNVVNRLGWNSELSSLVLDYISPVLTPRMKA